MLQQGGEGEEGGGGCVTDGSHLFASSSLRLPARCDMLAALLSRLADLVFRLA